MLLNASEVRSPDFRGDPPTNCHSAPSSVHLLSFADSLGNRLREVADSTGRTKISAMLSKIPKSIVSSGWLPLTRKWSTERFYRYFLITHHNSGIRPLGCLDTSRGDEPPRARNDGEAVRHLDRVSFTRFPFLSRRVFSFQDGGRSARLTGLKLLW